jgi:hypothetical protein
MAGKPKPPAKKKLTRRPRDPKAQSKAFMEFARAHGATEDVLDKALREVGKAKPKKD